MAELPQQPRLPTSGLYFFSRQVKETCHCLDPWLGIFVSSRRKTDALSFLIVLLSVHSPQPPDKYRTRRSAAGVTNSLLRPLGLG